MGILARIDHKMMEEWLIQTGDSSGAQRGVKLVVVDHGKYRLTVLHKSIYS